jgi:hypothetical protein
LSAKNRRALDVLANTLIDRSETHPGTGTIPRVPLTTLTAFRSALKTAGVTSRDNSETERKQFGRITEKLDEAAFSECMTTTAGGSGHDRDKAGHGPVVPARGTGTDRDTPFRGMSRLSRPGSHSRLPALLPATERPVTTVAADCCTSPNGAQPHPLRPPGDHGGHSSCEQKQ